MKITDKILDYDSNKEDVDYWFSIKCEQKYDRFITMLQDRGIETTWENVSGLYRYDKRLMFNAFRYISFLEEYLRAIAVRAADDKDRLYTVLQEKTLNELIPYLRKLNDDDIRKYFGSKENISNLDQVRKLRNCIAHNRIIIQEDNYRGEFNALHTVLPSEYRENFKKDVINSMKGIDVSKNWQIFD